MRNRFIKLSVVAVLMLSFLAVGCPTECDKLKGQLDSLRLQIFDIIEERQKVDAEGKDMGRALELHQQESNLRRQYETTSDKYRAAGCEGETGEVPSLPPMMPVTETAFE